MVSKKAYNTNHSNTVVNFKQLAKGTKMQITKQMFVIALTNLHARTKVQYSNYVVTKFLQQNTNNLAAYVNDNLCDNLCNYTPQTLTNAIIDNILGCIDNNVSYHSTNEIINQHYNLLKGEQPKHLELYLKTIKTSNNQIYYYAFNRFANCWQRISKHVFNDWLRTYFGLNKTTWQIVSSNDKTSKYKVTKKGN